MRFLAFKWRLKQLHSPFRLYLTLKAQFGPLKSGFKPLFPPNFILNFLIVNEMTWSVPPISRNFYSPPQAIFSLT